MRISFDAITDALYFRLRDEDIAESFDLTDTVYLDVDANGRVIGVEFALASEFFAVLMRSDGLLEIPEHIDLLARDNEPNVWANR